MGVEFRPSRQGFQGRTIFANQEEVRIPEAKIYTQAFPPGTDLSKCDLYKDKTGKWFMPADIFVEEDCIEIWNLDSSDAAVLMFNYAFAASGIELEVVDETQQWFPGKIFPLPSPGNP